jgi:hypothetical protein
MQGLRAAIAIAVAQTLWLISAPGCGGSGADLGCPGVAGCGGDPTGKWILQSPDSYCAYVPPLSYNILVNAPPLDLVPPQSMVQQTPGKSPPAAKSAGDWCYALQYEPPSPADAGITGLSTMGGITSIALPQAPGGVSVGAMQAALGSQPVTFVMDSTHEYSIGVKTYSQNQVHFAPSCLSAYGPPPTCADLQAQIVAFVIPNYNNVTCLPASDGGCDCSYSFAGAAADTGSWRTAGNIIYFLSDQNVTQPVVEADYCIKDDGKTFVLGGHNGESMFADKGLRSLTLSYNGPPDM